MSDLVFLTPRAENMTVTSSGSDTDLINLQSINKSAIYEDTSTASSISFTYNAAATNFDSLYIGNLNLAASRCEESGGVSVNVKIEADDNAGFTSPETTNENVGLSDLIGLEGEDYFTSISFTQAYQYWRITLTKVTGSDVTWAVGKILLNTALDYGCAVTPIKYDNAFRSSARYRNREFTVKYEGITEAERESFFNNLVEFKDSRPVVMVDKSSGSDLLPNSEQVVFGKVNNVNFEYRTEGFFNAEIILESSY